ncbi:MAG: hypothetical protein HOP13_05145 [Alphaproteobacteria bacterium]|nr:hypothetical protein [Alphaproteobacteria bacterium]
MRAKPKDQSWHDWLYNAAPDFGRVPPDLAQTNANADTLFVTGKTAGFDRLPNLKALRRLQVREIAQEQLDLIGTLKHLTELRVFGLRGESPAALGKLTNLEVLTFEWAPKVETLGWLTGLKALRVLTLGDLKRVNDFAPVSKLGQLSFLYICGSATSKQAMASIAPIAQLKKLEELSLFAEVSGGNISPLAAMTWLKRLNIANNYPVETFAELATRLKTTKCEAFAPTRTFTMGGETYIDLIGKPFRRFAKNDPKAKAAIAKREAEFAHWRTQFEAKRR